MTTYSAPGKALLAGGYLVLFPEYEAFSVALSSRIHAVAESATGETLTVSSPQFVDAEWTFPASAPSTNPFLAACFDTVSSYFEQPVVGKITIWSDDGFHTQSHSVAGPNARFRYHKAPITEVPKTGLGSSAALVAAVLAAMAELACTAAGRPLLETHQLHNLAQIAHCIAQGKVGSGFDVATAIYGSISYSRFAAAEIPSSVSNSKAVQRAVDRKWEMVTQPCKLPADVVVVMGDVAQGSQTPGMVRGVLSWREKYTEEAFEVFSALNTANIALSRALQSSDFSPAAISATLSAVRREVRVLTEKSGVPIEPPSQTQLLNAASRVAGVLGGVVPGAGGDDAVCLLVNTADQPLGATLGELQSIEGVKWIPMGLETTGLKRTTQ